MLRAWFKLDLEVDKRSVNVGTILTTSPNRELEHLRHPSCLAPKHQPSYLRQSFHFLPTSEAQMARTNLLQEKKENRLAISIFFN